LIVYPVLLGVGALMPSATLRGIRSGMTNERPAPVGHQALSAQGTAGVPVLFR
jgi:hypothetical protein